MSFRKIDVDAYDEDVLQETELYDPDPREPAQVLSDAKQKQLAVRSALNKLRLSLFHPPFFACRLCFRCLLGGYYVCGTNPISRSVCVVVRRGDITGALNVALDSPPYGPNVEEAKVRPFMTRSQLTPPTTHPV